MPHPHLNEQRAVANVRERKRTQRLNQAYKQLQSIIPKEPSDKMSKIHTLKLALAYIDFLNDLLKESDNDNDSESSFQHRNKRFKGKSSDESPTCSPPIMTPHHYGSPTVISQQFTPSPQPPQPQQQQQCGFYATATVVVDNNQLHHHQHQSSPSTSSCCNGYAPTNSYLPEVTNHIPTNSTYYSEPQLIEQYKQQQQGSQSHSDDASINLRQAFREYRTGKRKSPA